MDGFDKSKREWHAAFLAAGHVFVLDGDGDPDYFRVSQGFCNGPECSVCGWSCCRHCTSIDQIPKCEGREKKIRDNLDSADRYEQRARKLRAEADQLRIEQEKQI